MKKSKKPKQVDPRDVSFLAKTIMWDLASYGYLQDIDDRKKQLEMMGNVARVIDAHINPIKRDSICVL